MFRMIGEKKDATVSWGLARGGLCLFRAATELPGLGPPLGACVRV
jgi:hypothetical protein